MDIFGGYLNYHRAKDVRRTVEDYNKWDGSAVIYYNPQSGRFWTDATGRLLARIPRKPTDEDIAVVSKDFLPQKTKISISTVKSMTENLLKNIENDEEIEV